MKEHYGKPWTYWQTKGKWKYILVLGYSWASIVFLGAPIFKFIGNMEYTIPAFQSNFKGIEFYLSSILILGPAFGWFAWYMENKSFTKKEEEQQL
ncbi:MAG: hypothetical protein JEZ03_11200 [Bacteroidales bacterium]|nr:hypothetical protein [Bacteroidales bacterium]